MALAKWPSSDDETRGSNKTGYLPGFGRDGLSRATARSRRCGRCRRGSSRSSRWRALCHAWSRCMVAPSPAMTAGRAAVAGDPVSAGKAAGGRERDGLRGSARARATRVGHAQRQGLRVPLRARAREVPRDRARRDPPRRCGQLAALQAARRRQARVGILRRLSAIARQRSTSVASASSDKSDEATVAERWPTNSLRPISSPSERLTLLDLAEAHLHARRAVADIQRVGGGCAGRDAALD